MKPGDANSPCGEISSQHPRGTKMQDEIVVRFATPADWILCNKTITFPPMTFQFKCYTFFRQVVVTRRNLSNA